MVDEKRNIRTYKVKDSIYKKAMKRAKKEKEALATLIERFIAVYASGEEDGIGAVNMSSPADGDL